MTTCRTAFVVAILAAGLALPCAGQTSRTSADTARPDKPGSISGRITAADTGRPLRRAHVTVTSVSRTGDVLPVTANTNSLGQYVAKDVPPGSYFVSVTRAGYLTLMYGQRRPGETGLPVEVRAGETIDDVDIAVPRGSVLAGTVSDELGDPYPGVRVDALQLRYHLGRREPFPAGVATTDDRGQFRIAGLQPGTYYLSASSTELWKTAKGEIYGYASIYYPGGPVERAEAVALGTSEVKSGLFFTLQAGRTARVAGRVQRDTGEPVAGSTVPLAYSYPGVVMVGGMRTTRTGADGTFEFKDVTPGVYSVGGGSSYQIITVAGADLDNLVLVSRTGSTVSGRLVADEGLAPPFPTSGVRVQLEAPFENVLPTVRVVSVDSDWSFTMKNLGGPFLFRVFGIPDDWMLKSVRLGEKDITDVPWDVPVGDKTFDGLEITVTRQVGRLSGTVLDASGEATAAATVVVFPDDRDLWTPSSRFVRVARPDVDGHFSVSALPPGTYHAIAREFVEQGQWEDQAFLEAALNGAAGFVLHEGGEETITLKLPERRRP